MTYYHFEYTLENGGNVSTVISRNKTDLEEERSYLSNYLKKEGAITEIKEEDQGDWISLNSEYEPVQVVGVGDEGRTFHYYITKAKDAHVFISTNKEELEDEVEEMKESSDVEVVQDLSTVKGKAVNIETEYQPVVR